MKEFEELSRLPRDEDYWNELESRIVSDSWPLATQATEQPEWWPPLVAHAWKLGVIAAAAMIAALSFIPTGDAEAGCGRTLLQLPEGDPLCAAFFNASTPPSLASILVGEVED